MDNGYSLADIAAANGGGEFGGNWVLILLFAMIFGWNNGGFGGNNAATVTAQDLQRAVDLNSIQTGQAALGADIQRTTYETIGATKDAAYNNLSEIRDVQSAVAANSANIINTLTAMQANQNQCCCDTKGLILENRYLEAQNTAAINANTTAQAQKVLDALSQNKIEDLQAQVGTLQNQLAIQNALCGVPKVNPYMYTITPNCNCGNI